MRVPVVPRPRQHLLFLGSWVLAILIGVQWYLAVVLICIFLMTYDVKHLFTSLFAIRKSLVYTDILYTDICIEMNLLQLEFTLPSLPGKSF